MENKFKKAVDLLVSTSEEYEKAREISEKLRDRAYVFRTRLLKECKRICTEGIRKDKDDYVEKINFKGRAVLGITYMGECYVIHVKTRYRKAYPHIRYKNENEKTVLGYSTGGLDYLDDESLVKLYKMLYAYKWSKKRVPKK